jgi:hypothetical protein
MAATRFEVSHTVFMAGNTCLKQRKGAGIGGILSPFGARCACIIQEYRWWLTVSRLLKGKITVLRLMDDTLMRYDQIDTPMLIWFEFLCYQDGLVVERDTDAARRMLGLRM